MLNNIKNLRKKHNITNETLARKLGISVPYMYNIETHDIIPTKYIQSLIEIFNCSEKDLYIDKNNTNTDNGVVSVRLYDIKASAGNGIIDCDDNYFSLKLILPFFNEITGLGLKQSDVYNNRFTFIKVDGDSMSPHINNNDMLLVDHHKCSIEHYKQIMVFRDLEGQLYIKEIHIPYTNKLSIISYNKGYKSWEEEDKDKVLEKFGGKIDIVGRVIWHGCKVDYFR